MDKENFELSINHLFLNSFFEKTPNNYFKLAKVFIKYEDYSASIALCLKGLSVVENEHDFEKTSLLILLAQNLYKCELPRRIYLRPLAVGIAHFGIRVKATFIRTTRDSCINLDILDFAILFLLLVRIETFERWGFFPKSFRTIFRKAINAISKS